MKKIPESAKPAARAMLKLAAAKNATEAKADSKNLLARMRTLAKNNKKWFVILALSLTSAAAAHRFTRNTRSKFEKTVEDVARSLKMRLMEIPAEHRADALEFWKGAMDFFK